MIKYSKKTGKPYAPKLSTIYGHADALAYHAGSAAWCLKDSRGCRYALHLYGEDVGDGYSLAPLTAGEQPEGYGRTAQYCERHEPEFRYFWRKYAAQRRYLETSRTEQVLYLFGRTFTDIAVAASRSAAGTTSNQ